MRHGIWLTVILAGAALLSLLQAQSAKSVWDGVYSADQASRGATLYASECASCHADDLLGTGPMPALAGAGFRKEWDGQSVGDLFERLSVSMPADQPGKLTRAQDADVLAFILKSNDFPAGTAEMPPSTPDLSKIRFIAARPK